MRVGDLVMFSLEDNSFEQRRHAGLFLDEYANPMDIIEQRAYRRRVAVVMGNGRVLHMWSCDIERLTARGEQ